MSALEANAPSFSIVIESENLRGADVDELFRCLDSLDAQTLHPSRAVECMLTNCAVVPDEVTSELGVRYPWLRVVPLPAATGYYDSKLRGAEMAAGEIVVFGDSDCEFSPQWLAELLRPFADDAAVRVVTGETSTVVTGPLTLGLAATYIFPPFSRGTRLVKTDGYESNNVAFRRSLLLGHPSPSGVPCFRGHGVLHARSLRHDGEVIWQSPRARVDHPFPGDWIALAKRYLRLGHEAFVVSKLIPGWLSSRRLRLDRSWAADARLCAAIAAGRIARAVSRLTVLVRDKPARLAYLPIAIPVALGTLTLFLVGVGVSYFSPTFLDKALGGTAGLQDKPSASAVTRGRTAP